MDIYCEALSTKGVSPLHLTEKPTRCFPILVDLDFRFSTDEGENRRFDDEFVTDFVTLYAKEIYKILDTETDKDSKQQIEVDILTRSGPYVDKDVLKDGIHIVFKNVHLTGTIQQLLRRRVLSKLQPILSTHIDGLLNSAEDVLDAHATTNNWQMYGSCKPGKEPYLVTRDIRLALKNGSVDVVYDEVVEREAANKWSKYVKEFSLRRVNTRSRISPQTEELAIELEREHFLKQKAAIVDQYPHEMSLHERNVTQSDIADDETITAATIFSEMLSSERAKSYDSWIRVGWALRNIDHRLLKAWTAFSQKSSKYVKGECDKFWHHMRREAGGLTFGSLRRWAQLDNPTAFGEYAADSRREVVMEALSGTHNDLAKLVHSMYKDEFVCSELKSNNFYQFKNHKWTRLEQAHAIRNKFSSEVFKEIKNTVSQFTTEIDTVAVTTREPDANDKTEKKDTTKRVLDSLKDCGTKDKILKECAELFYQENFEQTLDEKTHLIGFNNGIFDLNKNQFREGRPEDLVSMCTGIDYEVLENDEVLFEEIDDFFRKVFPNKDMRDYAIGRFANFISGDVSREEFYIFTGSGSNGKSKTIELFEASFGGYCCKLPTSLLTQKRAAAGTPSGELHRTKARRFCVLQEPGESERLNVGIMKELSGGDKIQCRPLYGVPVEFKPQFNMVMTCNTLPEVPDNDGGTWRRIKVIEFGSKFVSEPKAPNEFEMDPDLNVKFDRWKRPFMIMLIRRYIADKGKKVVEPLQVSAITQRYREEQDHLAAFVKENFQKAEGCEISVKDVHVIYKDWCKLNLAKMKPDQMMSMVTKLKATDMKEPVDVENVPLLRHVYKNWAPMDD
jgi:P4 family phage/plasmid primase-like protien